MATGARRDGQAGGGPRLPCRHRLYSSGTVVVPSEMVSLAIRNTRVEWSIICRERRSERSSSCALLAELQPLSRRLEDHGRTGPLHL